MSKRGKLKAEKIFAATQKKNEQSADTQEQEKNQRAEKHQKRILERWTSTHSNARMEAMNGLFQAARARARGYRNTETFIIMIYLIAAPLGDIFKST